MMLVLRLLYTVAWLILGTVVLLRYWLLPERLYAQYDPLLLTMVGLVGLTLACYNVWRYLRIERHWKKATPAPPRPPATPPEYNPEFDFTQKPAE